MSQEWQKCRKNLPLDSEMKKVTKGQKTEFYPCVYLITDVTQTRERATDNVENEGKDTESAQKVNYNKSK